MTKRIMQVGISCLTFAFVVPFALAAETQQCCGKDGEASCSAENTLTLANGNGRGGPAKAKGAKGARAVMPDAHTLVNNHNSIQRSWEAIPHGIRSVTTTDDPALLPILQRHVRDMYEHLHNGGHVRARDPLFRELAANAQKVKVKITDLPNGLEVVSTSDDDAVVLLIRAHSKKVSEFVDRGMDAMIELTPLPEGYAATKAAENGKASCCDKN